jgi:hypothetical protein
VLHKNINELIDENRKSIKTFEKFKQKCVNFKPLDEPLNSTFSSNEKLPIIE